jgi:hypothetical protein
MPSSYTSNLAIEKPANGEQVGTWGSTVNDNMDIVDRLTSQVGSIALTGTTHTLTTSNAGVLSDGHYSLIKFTGTPGGTCTVTIDPNNIQRIYTIYNTTNQTVIMSQGSGSTVSVPAGEVAQLYADGAGSGASVVQLTDKLKDVLYSSDIGSTVQGYDADLAAIGALAKTDGNFIVGNGSTWVAESGNTALNSLGVTATATELNTLDGITASTAELNILDGLTATTSNLNTASTHYVPSGGIILWSGSVASIPSGWFLCDGNNSTPDLRDRFVVGAGSSYAVGATGGASSVTLSTSQIPSHTHTFSGTTSHVGDHTHSIPDGSGVDGASALEAGLVTGTVQSGAAGAHSHTFSGTTAATGSGSSHENRPPYYALAYIMKA